VTRVLGLDVGERRIGIALGDPTGIIASPLTALDRKAEANYFESIISLVQMYDVRAVVVGLPISLDGTLHTQGQEVMEFLEDLRKISPVPILPWDERFTTVQAEKMLREAGRKPSHDRGRVDAAAAAIVLQSYLDSQRVEKT